MSRRSRPYHRHGGGWRHQQRPSGVLEAGLRGFLCTCNNRERECIREAQNLLGEYADLLNEEDIKRNSGYQSPTSTKIKEESEEEDIADSVQREVRQIKAESKACQLRFRVVNSGAKNCIFLSSTVSDPAQLVHRLLSDLKASQRPRARFLLRLLPVEITCRAQAEDITQAASKLFDRYFSEGNKTFSIIYKCRNNSSMNRELLIEMLADLVKLKNASNRADLSSPQLAVLVEILRTTCCMAVVSDYFTLAKYNVLEVAAKPVAAITRNDVSDTEDKPANEIDVSDTEDKSANEIGIISNLRSGEEMVSFKDVLLHEDQAKIEETKKSPEFVTQESTVSTGLS